MIVVRRLSAHYILPGDGRVLKYGILEMDSEGRVLSLVDTGGALSESHGLEFYNGVLVPGFVNAHCHLELSHLGGRVTARGLVPFLKAVLQYRSETCPVSVMEDADREMWAEGIVAVGDISNTSSSFSVKRSSSLIYHTFVELSGLDPGIADIVMKKGNALLRQLSETGLRGSLSPHAPYSVSRALMEALLEQALFAHQIVSIHHQESEQENLLFQVGEGSFLPFLREIYPSFQEEGSPGVSSFEYFSDLFVRFPRLLLVHNTFSDPEQLAGMPSLCERAAWVFCPRSNLLLEGKLPDAEGFFRAGLRVALGTDSLASNASLSVLSEMILLQEVFPAIPFPILIQWATSNGAWALGLEEHLGRFTRGLRPGVNLIERMDLNSLRLLPQSRVRRIL